MAALKAARRLDPPRLRIIGLAVLMSAVWIGMGFRLFTVQVVHAAEYTQQGIDQRVREEKLQPTRGRILDRNGDPLALSIDGVTLYAVPQELDDPVWVAQQVAILTGANVDRLRSGLADAIADGTGFVYLARQLDPEVAQAVIDADIGGVYSVKEPKRMYPTGQVGAQVVGVADIDGNGLEGLERVYDDVLVGTAGRLLYERGARGGPNIPQGPVEKIPAIPGDDLVTTIDTPLQFAATEACQKAVDTTGAASCWVVAYQPETGEILALTGVPSYDPVARTVVGGGTFSNAVVREQYEPGSTQKLITLAAALETGAVDLDTVIGNVGDKIEINEGACRSDDDDIRGCFGDSEKHETRDMTVQEIFTRSSNVGTIKIASLLPEGAIDLYMQRFGYGRPTGVDFNGEASGQISVDPSCSTCLASAAIGYSVAVTPLQLAAAYGAVANDGVWVEPHLVSDVGGDRVDVESKQVISENTARVLRILLEKVVEEGTGTEAQVSGYTVGGKTGTSSKLLPDGTYADDDNIASFVGMAPIDDPKVVVAVVLDSPDFSLRFGGLAAAPVFSEVMQTALQRMGVTPDAVPG
ncbi:MAG: penicillin-binding protein 2 [Acidimicrobiia bacterium]|nr:penicillin-binding protein 2 [Acidimicrobiia bacterium]MDH4307830.1 penicillin-binding protein 2 [Acidimicrobiia bacterium]